MTKRTRLDRLARDQQTRTADRLDDTRCSLVRLCLGVNSPSDKARGTPSSEHAPRCEAAHALLPLVHQAPTLDALEGLWRELIVPEVLGWRPWGRGAVVGVCGGTRRGCRPRPRRLRGLAGAGLVTRHRARVNRLAREQAARDAQREPFVDPEVRRWADEHGVYLAPDDELRELHRTHRFDDDPAALRELADALGLDLDGQ